MLATLKFIDAALARMTGRNIRKHAGTAYEPLSWISPPFSRLHTPGTNHPTGPSAMLRNRSWR